MKKFFIFILFVFSCWTLSAYALEVPRLSGRVNDNANMISSGIKPRLESMLAGLEASDSTQFFILTIPSLEGESLDEYSIKVAETWGIGQSETDNGVLLLVSRDDRKIRIEVGYGLEGVLTDLLAGRIIDQVIKPYFKAGRFDDGFMAGATAIISGVRGEYKAVEKRSVKRAASQGGPKALLIVLFIVGVLGSINRIFGGIAGAVLLPIIAFTALSISPLIVLFLIPAGFLLGLVMPFLLIFSGFGSSRHHGGFGGGFSGGGGGGFGGGGASGGW